MNRHKDGQHKTQIDAWIEKASKELSSEQLIQLYDKALQTIYARSIITLSEVTLGAVLDRVLHKSQKKFPFFSGVKIKPKTSQLDGLSAQVNNKKPSEITEAFRYFFIELLTILENLTAGVLTPPLYRELSKLDVGKATDSRNLKHKMRNRNGDDI